jgi:hypothetical protein
MGKRWRNGSGMVPKVYGRTLPLRSLKPICCLGRQNRKMGQGIWDLALVMFGIALRQDWSMLVFSIPYRIILHIFGDLP